MGRITVHIHGPAKERAYGEMVKIYGDRLKSRGINLLFHKSKKSVDAYFTEINKSGLLFLLDESGVEHTSAEFSNLVREWTVSDKDVNLAIGPLPKFPCTMWAGVHSRREVACAHPCWPQKLVIGWGPNTRATKFLIWLVCGPKWHCWVIGML